MQDADERKQVVVTTTRREPLEVAS